MPPAADKVPLDWETYREAISELYWNREKELQEVIEIMQATHGFIATKKQFKKQLKGWGLEKNIKTREMIAMILIQKKRREEENKKTCFFVRNKRVSEEKLRRFLKRYKMVEIEATEAAAAQDEIPPDIRYCTPDPDESRDFRSPKTERSSLPAAYAEEEEKEVYATTENAQGAAPHEYDTDLQVPSSPYGTHQPYVQTSLPYWSDATNTHHTATDMMSPYSVPDDDSHLLSPNFYTAFTEHDAPLFSPVPSFETILHDGFHGMSFPGFFPSTSAASQPLFGGQAISYSHPDSAESAYPDLPAEVEESGYRQAYGADMETPWHGEGSELMPQTPVTTFNYGALDRSPQPASANPEEEDSISNNAAVAPDRTANAVGSDQGTAYAQCSCGMGCYGSQGAEPDATWR
ncbi:Clr5 domain-containing protein [Cercophora scortea]|uniref:Clr5 domain-containing protein n=1 Tax=Cercophora scortea TaxID=314031 RepID=A0AAE0MIS0_9PEZI|nr:Clr5 domain-containing protein [Cercophora scortea]